MCGATRSHQHSLSHSRTQRAICLTAQKVNYAHEPNNVHVRADPHICNKYVLMYLLSYCVLHKLTTTSLSNLFIVFYLCFCLFTSQTGDNSVQLNILCWYAYIQINNALILLIKNICTCVSLYVCVCIYIPYLFINNCRCPKYIHMCCLYVYVCELFLFCFSLVFSFALELWA